MLHLLGGGGLLVLQQVSVALGHPPALGGGHGRAQGTPGGGQQVLPVFTAGPGWIIMNQG